MIFSELYSLYYQTVAKILTRCAAGPVTRGELEQLVRDTAFSESTLTILPALISGRWPLLREDLSPVTRHLPSAPLTLLEKRWLRSLADDPRLKLFGAELPELEGVEPLFTRADYRVYDRSSDADPYEDPGYIERFRFILDAIHSGRTIQVKMKNKSGREQWYRLRPTGLEYSPKDDKFRIVTETSPQGRYNLGKLTDCREYDGTKCKTGQPERCRRLVLEVEDERNALERSMLHFAQFEKQVERLDDRRYRLTLSYYEADEAEMVIRVLSFGPYLKAVAPEGFVELIRQRLRTQMQCGLR